MPELRIKAPIRGLGLLAVSYHNRRVGFIEERNGRYVAVGVPGRVDGWPTPREAAEELLELKDLSR